MNDLQRAVAWLEEMKEESIDAAKKLKNKVDQETLDDFEQTAANCRTLLDALRWIPVSDRLPTDDDADEKGNVLCYWTDEAIETYQARWVDEWNSDRNHKDKITHWRPLPEPPESEG